MCLWHMACPYLTALALNLWLLPIFPQQALTIATSDLAIPFCR
jgi:hypothetical protein